MPTVHRKPECVAAGLVLIVGLAFVASRDSLAEEPYAQVPRELTVDPSYSQYAVMLIQLDLIANPQTANLPVSVVSAEPGTVVLTGTCPSDRMRSYLVENAKRISGLRVQDSMQVGAAETDFFLDGDAEQLEFLTRETLASLFPELSDKVRTTVTSDGTVVLTGTVDSYESKVMLSQAVKSQPGCRSVANLLRVPANEESGLIQVTSDGRLLVKASLLPTVPPAPLFDSNSAPQPNTPTIRAMTNRPIIADDAPDGEPLKQQLIEDAMAALQATPALAEAKLEVDAEGTVIILKGAIDNQKMAEKAVDAVSTVPGATKIVAKLSPVSIQRNLVVRDSKDSAKITVEPRKILGVIPLGKRTEQLPEESWVFRDSIKKTLKTECAEELSSIQVRHSIGSLLIEGEVKSTSDRNDVFKQIDNIVELRTVPYSVVLRIREL